MSLKLYADVHVRRAISVALHVRDVDVLTAQADGAAELEDPELLDRATALGRVLFTQDEDRPLHQPSGIDCQGLRASGYGQPNRIGDSSVAPG